MVWKNIMYLIWPNHFYSITESEHTYLEQYSGLQVYQVFSKWIKCVFAWILCHLTQPAGILQICAEGQFHWCYTLVVFSTWCCSATHVFIRKKAHQNSNGLITEGERGYMSGNEYLARCKEKCYLTLKWQVPSINRESGIRWLMDIYIWLCWRFVFALSD